MKLSIIIPCFNEQDTVAVILDRVKNEKTIESFEEYDVLRLWLG